MFGKKKRMIAEQQKKIEALTAESERLARENETLRAHESDVERREMGIGRAISEATLTADKLIEDAQRKAGALLEQTQTDCDAVRREAEILVDDAYRNARDIVKEAETEGQNRLDAVDQRIGQYAALLRAYDRLVQDQIQMAQDSAKRFAELSKALHEAVPQILAPDGTLLMPEPAETETAKAEPAEPESEGPEPAEPAEPEETPEEPHADEPAEEHLWTVDEIAKETGETIEDSRVDTIIDEILRASIDKNRE